MTSIVLLTALAIGQTATAQRDVHRWLSLYRTQDAESCGIMAVRSLHHGEYAEAIHLLRKGLMFDPSDDRLRHGLALARAEVKYDSANRHLLQPESEWYPGVLFASAFSIGGFVAFAIVCVALTRWVMVRCKRWFLVAVILAPFAIIPLVNELVRWTRAARNQAAPFRVVVRDAELREGNGWDYPIRLNVPSGAEGRQIGQRGDWVQLEFACGLVGWLYFETLDRPTSYSAHQPASSMG